jgi:hypothetical protein
VQLPRVAFHVRLGTLSMQGKYVSHVAMHVKHTCRLQAPVASNVRLDIIWFLALFSLVAIVPVRSPARRAFAFVIHLVWTVPTTVLLAILSHLTVERTAEVLPVHT